jgi:hypothetical protein
MEEEIKDDLNKTKPKNKKRAKTNLETTQKQIGEVKQNKAKTKKSTNTGVRAKSASTKKKKKTVEANSVNTEVIQAEKAVSSATVPSETSVAPVNANTDIVDDYIKDSDIQPTGQAGLSDIKATVCVENGDDSGDETLETNQLQESTETVTPNGTATSADPILSASNTVEATQNMILPFAAIKVRNIVGKVDKLVAEIIPNKVIVQGIVHDQVFFVGNDGIVHHMADDVNFSTFIDVPGIQPGMNANVSAIVEDIIWELAPDGLSILKKLVLEVFVKVTETVQLNVELGNGPNLVLNRVVGENSAQTLIESELTLFTPAVKIDEIIGSIQDISVETITDKVIVQGVLHKQIFFVDTDNMGRHQSEDVPFSFFVDIPGVTPGMDVQVHPRIEAIFFNLLSATIVSEKAILEFFVKVTENVIQQVAVGNGPLLKVAELIGENTVQELTETLITLNEPAIKIREIVAQARNLISHVIPNKVIIQGILHKQIYFIGTDNIEHHQAEDIPFSLFLDIPGAKPGNKVNMTIQIEAVFFDLISSTELRQKVILAVTSIVSEEIQLNLAVGAGPLFKVEQVVGENTKQLLVIRSEQIVPPPSPSFPPISPSQPTQPISPVIPERLAVTSVIVDPPLETVIGSQQILLQNSFPLPFPAIQVKQVNQAISGVSARVITDGVMVTGVVDKTVVLVGTDNIVKTIEEQVPFSILVNIAGVTQDQITNINVAVEDIIVNLNDAGTATNQTLVLKAEILGKKVNGQSITAVTNVTGTGVSISRVLMQGLIRTATGDVLQQIDVVTDVSGPGIIGVTHEQTDLLQIVGATSITPVTIVTSVQIAES